MLCIVDVDRTFNGSGSFPRGRPSKYGMMSKEKKANKALAKDKCLEVVYKKLSNPCKHGKQVFKRI